MVSLLVEEPYGFLETDISFIDFKYSCYPDHEPECPNFTRFDIFRTVFLTHAFLDSITKN